MLQKRTWWGQCAVGIRPETECQEKGEMGNIWINGSRVKSKLVNKKIIINEFSNERAKPKQTKADNTSKSHYYWITKRRCYKEHWKPSYRINSLSMGMGVNMKKLQKTTCQRKLIFKQWKREKSSLTLEIAALRAGSVSKGHLGGKSCLLQWPWSNKSLQRWFLD